MAKLKLSLKNWWDITHTVKDVGMCISKEEPTQIYSDNYYNTLGTGKKLDTGLGLMICRDFIKSIKGDFKVLSALEKVPALSLHCVLPNDNFFYTIRVLLSQINEHDI